MTEKHLLTNHAYPVHLLADVSAWKWEIKEERMGHSDSIFWHLKPSVYPIKTARLGILALDPVDVLVYY